MWFVVLNLSLTKRYSRRLTYIIQALWILLYRAVTVWLPFMSEIRMILFMVIFLALNLLCYCCHISLFPGKTGYFLKSSRL